MSEPVLAICTPHRESAFPAYWVDDLWALRRPGVANFFRLGHRPVAFARNELVKRVLDGPFTHLLWLDADMHFPPETFERLLAHDEAIVSGLYFSRNQTPIPHAYNWVRRDEDQVDWYRPLAKEFSEWMHAHPEEEQSTNCATFECGPLYRVDAIGFGCVLIRREVFEKIPAPWFSADPNGSGGGEDFDFCRKAAQAGYSVWVDFGLQCDHQLDVWFNGRAEFAQCWGIGQPNEHSFDEHPKFVVPGKEE